MPDFGYCQFKAISIWLNHHLGTENYRTDISCSEVLKWFHNMWTRSALIDVNAELKGEHHSNGK